MRKIIQIAAAGYTTADDYETNKFLDGEVELFALCDDGTLWQKFAGVGSWRQLPPIPQDCKSPSLEPLTEEVA